MPIKSKKLAKEDIKYTVTMEGSYYVREGQGLVLKPYKVKCYMSHLQLEIGDNGFPKFWPSVIFKHWIAPGLMERMYPGYVSLASFYVTDAKCNAPNMLKNNILLMTRFDLEEYIEQHGLRINPILYDDDMALRQAIWDFRKDPDSFKRQEAHLRLVKRDVIANRKILGKMASVEDLLELNGFEVEKETTKTKKQVKQKTVVKKIVEDEDDDMHEEDYEDEDQDEEDDDDLGV